MELRQLLLIGLLILLITAYFSLRHTPHSRNVRLRKKIRKNGFMPAEEFEKQWIISEKDRTGYKYNDFPGCYVIMIFKKPVRRSRFYGYENIYVGQSVNVCQRVHNHFNGKGNGDVYSDIKNGMYVYVNFVPVEEKRLNDMETALIEAYHATDSYNQTKGGAKIRQRKKR